VMQLTLSFHVCCVYALYASMYAKNYAIITARLTQLFVADSVFLNLTIRGTYYIYMQSLLKEILRHSTIPMSVSVYSRLTHVHIILTAI